MRFKLRAILLFILVGVLGVVSETVACTCMDPRTVDVDFKAADFVAVLKVEAVGKTYKPEKRLTHYLPGQALLSVSNVYKGDLKVAEKMVFRRVQSSMCGWSFSKEQIGSEYLFYFNGDGSPEVKPVKPAIWSADICSGSGLRSFKTSDIAYIEQYEKVKGKTRISGVVYKTSRDYGETVSGHKVTIKGEGSETVLTTNEDGVYEVYDLPPGNYEITAAPLEGFSLRKEVFPTATELKTAGHIEKEFTFVPITASLASTPYRFDFEAAADTCVTTRD